MVSTMDSGFESNMDQLIHIQEMLLKQIEEIEHGSEAKKYARELRTSKAALKGINQLLGSRRKRSH